MTIIKYTPVSVVMATYNGLPYIAEQLQSIISQLMPEDELIIVDDGSRDGTIELINKLKSPRVQVVLNPKNVGVLATFECGLRLCSKEIVFLCDQDDVWEDGKRDAFVEAFELDPSLLVVVSDAAIIDSKGTVVVSSFMAWRGGFQGGFWATIFRNRYIGCAMAIRRSLLVAALPIPRSVPMHDMWFGALASAIGRVRYIAKPFTLYRRHEHNASPVHSQGWMMIFFWRAKLLLFLVIRLFFYKVGRHVSPVVGNES